MDLAGGGASAFTCAVTFANDGCAVGLHRNPHSGDIDREEGAAVFTGEDTAGFEGLPAPAIKAEDSIGFRDRVPAFDVGEFAAIGFAGADIAADRDCAAVLCTCFAEKPITVSSRSKRVLGWRGQRR